MSNLLSDDLQTDDCGDYTHSIPLEIQNDNVQQLRKYEGCGDTSTTLQVYRNEVWNCRQSGLNSTGSSWTGSSCSSSQHDSGYITNSCDSISREFEGLKVTDNEKNKEGFVESVIPDPVKVHYEEVIPQRKEERCFKSLTGVDVPKDVVDEIYAQDEDGDTKLHMAIIHGQEEICNEFIHLAPTSYWLDIPNCLLQTPLHLAVITKLPLVIRRLMISGACISLQDTKGYTSLHVACLQNDESAALELLTPMQGYEDCLHPQMIPQNLEIKNYEGKTCLHLAAEQCNMQIMKLLLDFGADINAEDGKSGRTCLHYAAESGNYDLTEFLVSHRGLNVNSNTYGGETAMGLATGHRHYNIVKLLHEHGAQYSISERDELGPGSYKANIDCDMEEGNR